MRDSAAHRQPSKHIQAYTPRLMPPAFKNTVPKPTPTTFTHATAVSTPSSTHSIFPPYSAGTSHSRLYRGLVRNFKTHSQYLTHLKAHTPRLTVPYLQERTLISTTTAFAHSTTAPQHHTHPPHRIHRHPASFLPPALLFPTHTSDYDRRSLTPFLTQYDPRKPAI